MTDQAAMSFDWRDGDAVRKRVHKVIPNLGLADLAVALGLSHEYACDYLEQAPVLILAVTWGRPLSARRRPAEMAFLASRFRAIRGMKLKDAMAEFGLPLPLRKLRSTAIAPTSTELIWKLRSVPPSVLSQAIPDRVGQQIAFLAALRDARRRIRNHGADEVWTRRPELWPWFVKIAGAEAQIESTPRQLSNRLCDIGDMVAARFENVRVEWTFAEAYAAHERWVTELNQRRTDERFVEQNGRRYDEEIDYAPFSNNPIEVDGLTFEPLRSAAALYAEGRAMRHCVGGYTTFLFGGKARFYSVRDARGLRVATMLMLMMNGYSSALIHEIKGPCNRAVGKQTLAAATAFRDGEIDRIRKARQAWQSRVPGVVRSLLGDAGSA